MSELISLVFDATDPYFQPQMLKLAWADMWPRSFHAGESSAYVGATNIVLVTKPFTAGEDAAVTWALLQDECTLAGTCHLSNGNDLMLLDRCHRYQSLEDALMEQRRHLARKLDEIGVRVRV